MRQKALAAWTWVLVSVWPAYAGPARITASNFRTGGAAAVQLAPKAGPNALIALTGTALSPQTIAPSADAAGAFARPTDSSLERLLSSLSKRGALEAAQDFLFADALTGLPNRAWLYKYGFQFVRDFPKPTMAFLDMNDFGSINRGLEFLYGAIRGRERADLILRQAAAGLDNLAKVHKVQVVRYGGEEFLVLGAEDNVLDFCAAAKEMLAPGRLLEAFGLDEREVAEIRREQAEKGREGFPLGDFSYGVALIKGANMTEARNLAMDLMKDGKTKARGTIRVASGAAGEASKEWRGRPREGLDLQIPQVAHPTPTDQRVREFMGMLTPHERKIFEENAFYDPLTGLLHKNFADYHFSEWQKKYGREGGVVVVIGLRDLQLVNNALGYDDGDQYLRIAARMILQGLKGAPAVEHPLLLTSKEVVIVGRGLEDVTKAVANSIGATFQQGLMFLRPNKLSVPEKLTGLIQKWRNRIKLGQSWRLWIRQVRISRGKGSTQKSVEQEIYTAIEAAFKVGITDQMADLIDKGLEGGVNPLRLDKIGIARRNLRVIDFSGSTDRSLMDAVHEAFDEIEHLKRAEEAKPAASPRRRR